MALTKRSVVSKERNSCFIGFASLMKLTQKP
jgi:hypothetical protein